MGAFDESFPTIEAALADSPARTLRPSVEGDEPFVAIVAVLLGRTLNERKIAGILTALGQAALLEPQALAEAETAEVVDVLNGLRIANPAKVVAPIRRVARWLVERRHGSARDLRDGESATSRLREELAALNGIGQATADAILLFALRRPVYPLDRATYRILVRHGWLDSSADYEEARAVVERPCGDNAAALERLAEGFAFLGREFCRASVAKCERCPLRPLLPERGPYLPETTE